MAERTYEVKPVGVDYICDACGLGVMEPTGMTWLSHPAQWPHKCSRCGKVQALEQTYPTVRWERLPAH